MQVSVYEKAVNLLAVMSDGLTRLAIKLPADEPHLPFFQPLFAFVAHADEEEQASRHLVDFLTSERVCARTDDDKSLVLAVRLLGPELGDWPKVLLQTDQAIAANHSSKPPI